MICTSTRYSTGPNYCMKVFSCTVVDTVPACTSTCIRYPSVLPYICSRLCCTLPVSGIPLFSHTSAADYAVLYLYQVSLCSPVYLQQVMLYCTCIRYPSVQPYICSRLCCTVPVSGIPLFSHTSAAGYAWLSPCGNDLDAKPTQYYC